MLFQLLCVILERGLPFKTKILCYTGRVQLFPRKIQSYNYYSSRKKAKQKVCYVTLWVWPPPPRKCDVIYERSLKTCDLCANPKGWLQAKCNAGSVVGKSIPSHGFENKNSSTFRRDWPKNRNPSDGASPTGEPTLQHLRHSATTVLCWSLCRIFNQPWKKLVNFALQKSTQELLLSYLEF